MSRCGDGFHASAGEAREKYLAKRRIGLSVHFRNNRNNGVIKYIFKIVVARSRGLLVSENDGEMPSRGVLDAVRRLGAAGRRRRRHAGRDGKPFITFEY